MPLYTVGIREVHVAYYHVTASSEKEAIEKLENSEYEEISIEYSHTMDPDTWTATPDTPLTRIKRTVEHYRKVAQDLYDAHADHINEIYNCEDLEFQIIIDQNECTLSFDPMGSGIQL